MRRKDIIATTSNSRTYMMLRRIYNLHCSLCPPNRKENWKNNHPDRSWKSYRNHQYRDYYKLSIS